MKHRPTKIHKSFLLISLLILLSGFFLSLFLSKTKSEVFEEEQRRAMARMERAEAYIKESILEKGILLEDKDLNKTGLLGPEFTELTSTLGDEGAKRSSLNPEFAAVMVRYFHEAGLKEGDAIAVGSSGSFPGFVIAVLSAATEMKLEARVISSLGASTYGATRVDYNIFDVLEDLKKSGEVDFILVGVSCGGEDDRGGSAMEGFLFDGTPMLSYGITLSEAERTGAAFIYSDSLVDSIQERLRTYGDDIKMFINIGGASSNLGTSSCSLDFPPGLVMSFNRIPEGKERGLIFEYMERGVPVVNLLSVKKLCQMNSIPFDPVPLPSSSSSRVFSTVTYNPILIIITLMLAILVLIIGILETRRKSIQ